MDMKPPFHYRMAILMLVGACSPVLLTTMFNHFFDYSVKKGFFAKVTLRNDATTDVSGPKYLFSVGSEYMNR